MPHSSNPKRSCPLAAHVRKICVLSALMISGLSGSTRGTYLAIFQKMIKWNSEYRSKLAVKKKKKIRCQHDKRFFWKTHNKCVSKKEG